MNIAFATFASAVSPLTDYDLGLLLVIAVGVPALGLLIHVRDKAGALNWPLMRHYQLSLGMLWGLSALVLAATLAAGRPFSELGLSVSTTLPFLGALLFALIASTLYAAQILSVRRSAKARAQLADLLERQHGVDQVLPQTLPELRTFRLVAVTAGVTEELLFRGFLIWCFAHWMNPWLAAACALVAFTAAHLYQETPRALAGVVLAGAVMTILVMVSGSIIPAMVLHASVDLAGGEMAWLARQAQRNRS